MTIALRSQRTATALLAIGCVATADQLSKIATADLPPDTVAFIHPLRNHAFSLQLLNAPPATEITLMLLILIISTAWAVKRIQQGRLHPAAAGLIIGGCTSNIVDRVLLGSVRDFLRLGHVVINVADIAILAGILLISVPRRRHRTRR
jgi:lipoprotein signal peptidase